MKAAKLPLKITWSLYSFQFSDFFNCFAQPSTKVDHPAMQLGQLLVSYQVCVSVTDQSCISIVYMACSTSCHLTAIVLRVPMK